MRRSSWTLEELRLGLIAKLLATETVPRRSRRGSVSYIYAHAPHATPHTRLASVSVTRVVLNCEELRGTSMTEGIALGVTAVVSSAPRDVARAHNHAYTWHAPTAVLSYSFYSRLTWTGSPRSKANGTRAPPSRTTMTPSPCGLSSTNDPSHCS